ncbi:MAG: hypothetical protein KAR35_07210 [Candidatus Heimdallarchaeota archaeon]|nr:hypothetical protein [Candidatus Heimdallarchaeota archaeon]MCK5049148.1 hypothetical protein [Candidatus Heimdallarchaeota archaeon]
MDLVDIAGFYPYVFIVTFAVVIYWFWDRIKYPEEEENKILDVIAFIAGIINIIWTVLIILAEINEDTEGDMEYVWFSLLLMFFLGLSLVAKPVKRVPIAAILSFVTIVAIVIALSFNRDDLDMFEGIPLWIFGGIILAIVGIFFLLTRVTELGIDQVLTILGWEPITLVLVVAALLQGLAVIMYGEVGLGEFFDFLT